MQKPIISIGLFLFLLSCNNQKASDEKQQPEVKDEANQIATTVSLTPQQASNAGIAIGKLEMQYISSSLKVSGQIDVPPQNMVTISVPMGGYLSSTRLLPGMHVSKGQAIAVVQDQQYIQMQQDYLTAKARLSFLEKE